MTTLEYRPPVAPAAAMGSRLAAAARLLAPTAGYTALALVYSPIVWLILMSVSGRPLSGIPSDFTLDWYRQLFARDEVFDHLGTSAVLASAVAAACVVVATAVGRVALRLPRGGTLIALALVPLFVPGVMLGVALFLYLRVVFHLQLGMWSLFLVHLIWAFPFALLAVLIAASRFDRRLAEAAVDLGASSRRAFWDVELPAIRPGIIAAGIFGFLLSFNDLPHSILLHGPETTLPLYMWAQAAGQGSTVPLVYALSSLVLVASTVLVAVAFWALFLRREQ
jgi:ABC-type spermidine/putrescine transport system permease subunit II